LWLFRTSSDTDDMGEGILGGLENFGACILAERSRLIIPRAVSTALTSSLVGIWLSHHLSPQLADLRAGFEAEGIRQLTR